MALADWDIQGTGTLSIVVDGASPGTNTDVLDLNNGFFVMRTTAVSDTNNGAVEAYIKIIGGDGGFYLRATSTTANIQFGYRMTVSQNGSNFNVDVTRYSSFAGTVIAAITTAPLTGVNTDYQKWRFSAFTQSSTSYVRVELFNGSSYIPIIDFIDTNSGAAAASGKPQIWLDFGSHARYDDFKFYSLA